MPIYKMNGKKDGLQKYRVRINYTDSTGKAKQLERVAYGREEASELEARLRSELKELSAPRMTVQELYDEYIRSKKYEVREATIDKIKQRMEGFVLPPLKDYKLEKLSPSVLQKWKSDIEERTTASNERLSLKYKQNIYGTFKAFLNYAVHMEYVPKNPLDKVGNFKDANAIKKKMDFYTAEEFLEFIAAAYANATQSTLDSINEWNYYVFFNIAFYTGMRKGEIYALKWTDIDDNIIHVSRSITQKVSGGDRETPPKNKSSIRNISIPMPLKEALDIHYNNYKTIDGFNDDWYICGGKSCIRDTTLENHNKMYAKLAGVKKIRIHDFRHSHASLLANNGINIQEVARRLGHSNVEMTWNTYSHLYPQEDERVLSVLNKIK